MAVRDGGNDVFGTEGRVAAEKHAREARGEGHRVDQRHSAVIEGDAEVGLDPGKGVLLADRNQHVVARDMHVGLAGRNKLAAAALVLLRLDLLEPDSGEPAGLVGEGFGDEIVEDFDALVSGVLLFPGRSLHLGEARAHDNLDLGAAEAAGGAAAVHRRVAAAEHHDALADRMGVAEEDAREPLDADADVSGRLAAARDVEVPPMRRAAADEDRVVALLEKRLHAGDAARIDEGPAGRERIADLLVDHLVGQAEFGNLAAHHSAGARIGVEHHDLVADGGEVAGDGEGGGTGADAGDALAVALVGGFGRRPAISPLRSAATRFSRQMATGCSSSRPRRQAGSHGRSQVRPRMPGKTFDFQLIR